MTSNLSKDLFAFSSKAKRAFGEKAKKPRADVQGQNQFSLFQFTSHIATFPFAHKTQNMSAATSSSVSLSARPVLAGKRVRATAVRYAPQPEGKRFRELFFFLSLSFFFFFFGFSGSFGWRDAE